MEAIEVDESGKVVGKAPKCCPSCFSAASEIIHTQILGWECSACRVARQGRPGPLRGQAAVNARRDANISGKLFTLDGEPLTGNLVTFLQTNADDISDEETARILSLGVGERMVLGGGAGAEFEFKRVA